MSAFICEFSSPGRQAAREGGSRNGTNPRILEQGSINEEVSTLSESLLEAFSTMNDKRFRVDAQDRHEIERVFAFQTAPFLGDSLPAETIL